ncbi:MAG: hypothetical protein U0X76_08070 [Bacteroidia bacterium]
MQELPDPISKITWDNYLAVSMKDAREKGWVDGNVVAVKAGNVSMNVPVVVQPGQTARNSFSRCWLWPQRSRQDLLLNHQFGMLIRLYR